MNWLTNRFFSRFPFRSILLTLLLVSINVLLFFGISQYRLSREQFRRSEELYITTVKLNDRHLENRTLFSSDTYWEWDYSDRAPELLIVPGLEEELISFHEKCDEVLVFDNRRLLTAISDDLFRLSDYFDMDVDKVLAAHQQVEHETPLRGIVSARCIKVVYVEPSSMRFDPNAGELKPDDSLQYKAYFEIDHSNSELDPLCDEVRYMEMTLYSLDEAGNPLFQEGYDYNIAAHGRVFFRFPDNTDALSKIDPEPQYALYASPLGVYSDQRIELIDMDSHDTSISWFEDYGRQEIAREVIERLPLGFPADKVNTAFILPDIYYPIWDLSEELTAEELTRKEEEFDELRYYIQLPARQFSAIVTKEPGLIFEFSDGFVFVKDELRMRKLLKSTDESACLISSAMAEQYNIEVGDTLNFGLIYEPCVVAAMDRERFGYSKYDTLIYRSLELKQIDFRDYKTYSEQPPDSFVVVGITDNKPELGRINTYGGDRFMDYYPLNDQGVMNNTIIIVDRGEGFSDLPLVVPDEPPFSLSENRIGMMSARLKNGSAAKEAYLAGMREAGLDEYIIDIDDHGYSEVEKILLDLVADGQRQMYLFVSVAVLLLLFFLVMVWRFFKPELERMYILGTMHKVRRKTLNSVLILYWLINVIIGAALSFLVFRSSLANMALELDLSVSEVAGSISQYVLIFAAVCVLSLIVSLAAGSVMSRRTKER